MSLQAKDCCRGAGREAWDGSSLRVSEKLLGFGLRASRTVGKSMFCCLSHPLGSDLLETNENENMIQNQWFAAKAVLRGKFTSLPQETRKKSQTT